MILRGQQVNIDDSTKTLRFEILKPLGSVFSISDSIKHYVDLGYTAKVKVAKKEVIITKETPFLRKEEVKSKFPDTNPWHRYWYTKSNEEQMRLL